MQLYVWYLTIMSLLFTASAVVLFGAALGQAMRRRIERAAVYLGLTLLSCVVAAGFYFSAGSSEDKSVPERTPSGNLIGVLISGRGSNLIAILDRIDAGDLDARVALVISNEPLSAGLQAARARGVRTLVIDHRASATREDHDQELARALEEAGVRLICLAGYMRLLSGWFVDKFKGRIMNIHPSLLPSFPGTRSQRQALESGVKISGCTVHFVDEQVDSGPIILQEAVPVLDGDTPEALEARILEAEHRVYSRAISLYLSGSLRIAGRRVLGATPAG